MNADVALRRPSAAAPRARLAYVALACLTIAVGLLVHRGGASLPPDARDVLGDALWAMMLAWWAGALAPRAPLAGRAAVALAACVAVELSQLVRAPALDAVRATTLGHLVLGSDFDARDLLAYAAGVLAAVMLERVLRHRRRGAAAMLAVLGAAGLAPSARAQAADPASPRAETFVLGAVPDESVPGDTAGRRYRIHVLLPPGFDTLAAPPPVLYYLDAWWWRELMEGTHRLLALAAPPRLAPVVLVGIAVEGSADDWNRARNRDLTPSPYRPVAPGVRMRTGNVELDSAGTGGARRFLDYLEHRLIPAVESRYRVRAGDRGLAGHSYGGLFGAWVLGERPALFDRLLLVSPATYWNDGEVLAPARLDRLAGRAAPPAIFVAAGARELPLMRRSADQLAEALEARGARVTAQRYEGADHLTVLPRALLDGLVALYGR